MGFLAKNASKRHIFWKLYFTILQLLSTSANALRSWKPDTSSLLSSGFFCDKRVKTRTWACFERMGCELLEESIFMYEKLLAHFGTKAPHEGNIRHNFLYARVIPLGVEWSLRGLNEGTSYSNSLNGSKLSQIWQSIPHFLSDGKEGNKNWGL